MKLTYDKVIIRDIDDLNLFKNQSYDDKEDKILFITKDFKFPDDCTRLFANSNFIDYPDEDSRVIGEIRAIIFEGGIDTSNVKNMKRMFTNCNCKLIGLEYFNTENVENMYGMFSNYGRYSDEELSLKIHKFNTSKVKRMDLMFWNSKAYIDGLSYFNTSNVETMAGMFEHSTMLDNYSAFKNWDVSKVRAINNIFNNTNMLPTNFPFHRLSDDCSFYTDREIDVDYIRFNKHLSKSESYALLHLETYYRNKEISPKYDMLNKFVKLINNKYESLEENDKIIDMNIINDLISDVIKEYDNKSDYRNYMKKYLNDLVSTDEMSFYDLMSKIDTDLKLDEYKIDKAKDHYTTMKTYDDKLNVLENKHINIINCVNFETEKKLKDLRSYTEKYKTNYLADKLFKSQKYFNDIKLKYKVDYNINARKIDPVISIINYLFEELTTLTDYNDRFEASRLTYSIYDNIIEYNNLFKNENYKQTFEKQLKIYEKEDKFYKTNLDHSINIIYDYISRLTAKEEKTKMICDCFNVKNIEDIEGTLKSLHDPLINYLKDTINNYTLPEIYNNEINIDFIKELKERMDNRKYLNEDRLNKTINTEEVY